MAGSLDTELELQHDAAVLMVRGEVDMATAPVFSSALERTVSLGVSVVVDMAGVTFMDSSGLKVLIEVSTRQSALICVRSPSSQVSRLIAFGGLEGIFCTDPDHHGGRGTHEQDAVPVN